jgi:hypothetical protein
MPDPLTVTPAELTEAATAAGRIARLLGDAIVVASVSIGRADVPSGGWLTTAATHRVGAIAFAQLRAIARDLGATSTALAAAVAAYEAADDRAARRYPAGPLAFSVSGSRATPW